VFRVQKRLGVDLMKLVLDCTEAKDIFSLKIIDKNTFGKTFKTSDFLDTIIGLYVWYYFIYLYKTSTVVVLKIDGCFINVENMLHVKFQCVKYVQHCYHFAYTYVTAALPGFEATTSWS
jgi:hypothetical protein